MARPFHIIVTIGCILALCACDVNYRSSVPNSAVQYTLYITRDDPNFVLDNGFQTRTVTERILAGEYIGYAGLLIWVGMDGEYHAADLCCPNCVKKAFPIEVDGIFAECPLCGERYDLSYGIGNPTKGYTKESLKRYTTILRTSVVGKELAIRN